MVGHQRSYVCRHVFDAERPVLLVSRADGDWVFVCGDGHPDDPDSYRVVGMDHVIEGDPTLREVLDLAVDEEAERPSVGGPWIRGPAPAES